MTIPVSGTILLDCHFRYNHPTRNTGFVTVANGNIESAKVATRLLALYDFIAGLGVRVI